MKKGKKEENKGGRLETRYESSRHRRGDSNGWARSLRARYFRGFAQSDTSIGVAILGHTGARLAICAAVERSQSEGLWRGTGVTRLGAARRGEPRRVQAWSPCRSLERTCRPADVRGIIGRKKKKFDRHARDAEDGGPWNAGALQGRRRDYLTRGRTLRARAPPTGGGHLALQSTAAAASSNSSQWSSVHDSSGYSYETHSFSLSRTRAHTGRIDDTHTRGTHDRILASLAVHHLPSRRPNPRGNSTNRLARRRPSVFLFLSHSALSTRGVLTWHVTSGSSTSQHVGASAGHPPWRAQEEDAADEGGDGKVQGRVRGVPKAAAGGSDAPRGSEWTERSSCSF